MARVVLVLLLAAAGCHVDLNDPGTEPLAAMFYYPAGILLDPDQKHLYVTNGNSDLKYGGGTVQMIDLPAFEAAVAQFRADPTVKNGCQVDPLDQMIVNCPEGPFIFAPDTVKVGNFAGNMQLQVTGPTTRRLFIGVRGDPSITWMDTDVGTDEPPSGHRLNCFTDPSKVAPQATPPGCDGDHLIQTYYCQGQPNCVNDQSTIPPEPFGMVLDQGETSPGNPYARLLVSHLSGGQVMIVDAMNLGSMQKQIPYISSPFFHEDSLHRHGAYALAPQRPGDPASPWYMTSDIQPVITTFRVADLNVIIPSLEFSVGGVLPTGNDVRDLVFQAGGSRAFITQNNPPSVMVLDTRPQTGVNLPLTSVNQIIDVIDVCQQPAHISLRTPIVEGAPGTPNRVQQRLYVVCFLSNQVMVVDPDQAEVLNTILVGRGPNTLAFVEGPHPRGYISNFSESTIGVLDLDPSSPTANRMVARIGVPVPPMNP